MSDSKEFQGKNLDEAIENACDYFNLNRNRLEIEILGGGSTGIFGIMGVKKATIKARPRLAVQTTEILTEEPKDTPPARTGKKAPSVPDDDFLDDDYLDDEFQDDDAGNAFDDEDYSNEPSGNIAEPEPVEDDFAALDAVNGNREPEAVAKAGKSKRPARKEDRKERAPRERAPKERAHKERAPKERSPRERAPRETEPADNDFTDQDMPRRERRNLTELDQAALMSCVREITETLLKPIVGDSPLEITIEEDRVKIFIDDEENSGLIIGREGQTLSALQYLINRLVSRRMETSIRIQVDTGDYRERQDEKLRQIAQHLADKANEQNRTQSTKPLSSYHRRVVHLALQDHETVFTRSKGDGPLKRVLIVPKRKGGRKQPRR